MKILFGNKYYGQDTSEVPSGFLVWIIEEYENADWLLVNECKKELSERLKLSWCEKDPVTLDAKFAAKQAIRQNSLLLAKIETLEKIMFVYGITHWDTDKYLCSPGLLEHDVYWSNKESYRTMPLVFGSAPFYQDYLKKERAISAEYLQRLSECKTIEELNNLKREAA